MIFIYENSTKTKFRLGLEDEDFDSTSDESLKNGILRISEKEITRISKSYGAVVEYYDFRSDKPATKKEYNDHFINYDSDKCYILPVSTFPTKKGAESCRKKLMKFTQD